ncbi:hypothetical protein [Janthinobacterium sp.]|uniref:hypothetical protein n=1 Tax=Janthinobacterium sp. TaxID=1871054 RepID=UPI00293D47B9|nr:hypothetical protein [Janthinobacterium sp.]
MKMNLDEYFAEFNRGIDCDGVDTLPTNIGAEVAAGYSIGLTIEQMRAFLTRRTLITSIAVGLKDHALSAGVIHRIDDARRAGAIYPHEVLARAFSPAEVRAEFHAKVFRHD